MKKAHRLLPLLVLFSLACGLVVPVPTPTPIPPTSTPTASPTATATSTPDIAATQTLSMALTESAYTPTPTATITPEVQPEDLLESETPLPPAAISPGADYKLGDEVIVGAYGLRLWHNTVHPMGFEDILMIEHSGSDTILIEQASAIHPLTGSDINGDKIPEAVIETYSGGAHCCFGTRIYKLGEEPQLLYQKPESNAGGQFEDLDKDGIQEFITYDDLFAYQYCSYAGSPFVKAILVYDPLEETYKPASPLFPDQYTADILEYTAIAEEAKPGDYGEWDESTKCSVLPMTLAYIYSGDTETARSELERVYPYPDVEAFWDEIMLAIQDSPLYVAPESE